jgi:hypothetical protein
MAISLQSAPAVNPLLFPPRLVLRALDDLHTIAESVRRIDEVIAMAS